MPTADRPRSRIRFGEFELNRGSAELMRNGRPVAIQQQPLRLLEVLVMRAGELVTREEIRQTLWPDNTFGEFDAGVGNAIRKIRLALHDDANNPRFVQTIPRQGFRFIAPVHFAVPSPQSPGAPAAITLQSAPERIAPENRIRGTWVQWGVVAVLLILAWAVDRTWLAPKPLAAPDPTGAIANQTRPFTTFAGDERHPALSPDGNTVAFDWGGNSPRPLRIWVQNVSATAPFPLTAGTAPEYSPAWSPDGSEVAFIRERTEALAGIYSVPVSGAGERKWGEFSQINLSPRLSWSADGKWFAVPERTNFDAPSYILLISAANGARRQSTAPPAGWLGDSEPAISPDGRLLAFRRTRTTAVEDLYVVPVAGGEPRRLTFDNTGLLSVALAAGGPGSGLFSHPPGGPPRPRRGAGGEPRRLTFDNTGLLSVAWTADGQGIVFSSNRAGATRALWRVPVTGGAPVRITPTMVDASEPAIALKGGRMAYVSTVFDVNIWELRGSGKTAAKRPLIDSNALDSGPQFSRDGKRVAFRSTRSGSDEVWIVDTDGGSPRQLTTMGHSVTGSPRWSADGQSLLFESRASGNGDIYLISADGGQPTRLTPESSNEILPSWSHDGKSFYFASDRGGFWQIWRQPLTGDQAVLMTPRGGFAGWESPDGAWLYYAKGGKTDGIWRVRLSGPEQEEELVMKALPADMWGNWVVAARGIYFIDQPKPPAHSAIRYYEFATKTTRLLTEFSQVPAIGDSGLAVSPDESRILFSQVDHWGADIFLVNGFR